MAVYTDGEHLMADKIEELHAFAKSIGLSLKLFEDYRYKYYHLISLGEIENAIAAGAIVLSTRELVKKFKN